jgi:radical SAM protein with 4Fe4S-binding SPASM domain
MTISNRAGSIEIKNDFFELKKLPEPLKESCYYPMYKVLIDYNGDVLMCSNDWKKQQIMGNVKNSTISNIWNSEKFIEMRKKLIKKDRNHLACNVCDVNGRLNGEAPFKSWVKYFKNSK